LGWTLELDINFLQRTPLWPPALADSNPIGSFVARQIPLLDVHELAAGKLTALFDRSAARDVFLSAEEDFETVLHAMSAVGLIRFYEVGGDRYLEIVNFDREQPGLHKMTKSDYPDPPDDFGKFPEEQNLT
jgi:hypothetical protein